MGRDSPASHAPDMTLELAPTRDPAAVLAQTWRHWDRRQDLWVFGYASLIWRPEFHADEQHLARVWGYHRSFRMRSRINRGTPAVPGLVFALVPGGSCWGMVYRIGHHRAEQELERLWAREMPTCTYDPRWLPCTTAAGNVKALAFTLSRTSPSYTGAIDDGQMVKILRSASGRFGTTLDYLLQTSHGLRQHGIQDREIERLAQLARTHGLNMQTPSPNAERTRTVFPEARPAQAQSSKGPDAV